MSRKKQRYNHRKIYESFNGAIPCDESGRSFEIHHLDGDQSNNSSTNLTAVSITDHYEIHKRQGDWGACCLILARMNLPLEEISKLQSEYARLGALARVTNGTHHFQGQQGSERNRKRNNKMVSDGSHHFLDPEFQKQAIIRLDENNKFRLSNGTHNFLDSDFQKKNVASQIAAGRHPFQDKEAAKERAKIRLSAGTHINQQKYTCPHCNKEGTGPGMIRWHFDKCKTKLTPK